VAKKVEPCDLADLFNPAFNQQGSCFSEKHKNDITQSQFLFLHKFHGIKGLISYLKSSYADIKLLDKNKYTKGIIGEAEDLKGRREQHGENEYPTQ
jgi:hypothetical protein